MGCIMTIISCTSGDRAPKSLHSLRRHSQGKKVFDTTAMGLACVTSRLKLTFGREHQSRLGHGVGGRDCSKHNFELRQVFQERGCRCVYGAAHSCVVTIYCVHTTTPLPQMVASPVDVSVQKMQPSCSITLPLKILPAGLAVTDSEGISNMIHNYKACQSMGMLCIVARTL